MLNTVVFFSSSLNRPMTSALAVFVERSCRFVEKDPAGFMQEQPHEGEAFLLAERKFFVPALHLVELGDEIAKIAPFECVSHLRIGKGVGRARIDSRRCAKCRGADTGAAAGTPWSQAEA